MFRCVAFVLLVVCTKYIESEVTSIFNALHLEDGSYEAEELVDGLWMDKSCTRGTYVDMYFDIDESHSHDNIFFEVIVLQDSPDLRTDAISMYMYKNMIPITRETEIYSTYSPDSTYSLSLNANEASAGRYFLSVLCNPDMDVNFGVFAETIPSEITQDAVVESNR